MSNCQYTGVQLDNPRAKNSPAVTKLLAEANKSGVYSDVSNAMLSAKADGKTGDDVLDAGRQALIASKEKLARIAAESRARRDEKRRAESARIADLRANGPRRRDDDGFQSDPEPMPPARGDIYSDIEEGD